MAVLISMRSYFSGLHIETAARAAREAKLLETNLAPETGYSSHHRGSVVTAVFSAVAFLEATANELFSDAAEGHLYRLHGLDYEVVEVMGNMWRRGVPRTARYSVLEKFAIGLTLARKLQMPKGEAPWQPASSLVRLRNALVHYEPEWVPTAAGKPHTEVHRFEKEFAGKFALNPLAGPGNPFYPDKVLGHGCAAWAVLTAVAFADEFARRMGIPPAHASVRNALATEPVHGAG